MNNSGVKYKIIDLFAGAGGLSNGFQQTGKFEVLGAVEINPAAVKTYIKNHGENENIIIRTKDKKESDITKIDFVEYLKDYTIENNNKVVVIGGPPCQGFSNANRQKNYLISGNNQLVKEFVRAILQVKPVAFLLENVKTMGSANHKFFITKSDGVYLSKFYLGSIEHMLTILKKLDNNIEPFWKTEIITLLETNNPDLKLLFKYLLENNINGIKPYLQNGFLSRLNTILRRAKKADTVSLKNSKEKKDIEQLLDSINTYKESKVYIEILQNYVRPLFDKVEVLLRKLLIGNVSSKDIVSVLSTFLLLNKWLLINKELLDEKIDCVIRDDNSGDFYKIIADVKTYNIVVYLKCVFEAIGYRIDADVLTASDYGVPQKRKRFMILGVKKDFMKSEKVELPEGFGTAFTTKDGIVDLEKIHPLTDTSEQPHIYEAAEGLSPLQKYFRKDAGKKLLNHINTKSMDLSIKRFKKIKDINGKNFHSLDEELKSSYADASRTQNTVYLRLNYDEPSPTVVNVRKSMWNHPKNAVAVSIREAARLQSFRDDFEFLGSKDQQYQQIGNAVPPLMARAVAEKMLEIMGDSPVVSLEEELGIKV